MARARSRGMPHIFRLPSELHYQIMMELDSVIDLRAWISTSHIAVEYFLEYKANVLAQHINDYLLPEALAVVRLRRIHEESTEPAKARDLVNLTCELLESMDPLAPLSALLPEDSYTSMALLELIEDVSLIESGITQCQSHPTLSAGYNDKWHQRPILLFELYAQCLYRNYEIYEAGEEQELYDRLDKAIEARADPYFTCSGRNLSNSNQVVEFVCRRNDDYQQLALRKVVRIYKIGGQPSFKSQIAVKEPAQDLREAIDDPIVCSRSTRLLWANDDKMREIQMLGKPAIDLMRRNKDSDVSVAQVGTWHTESGDVPVYRLACPEWENEVWNGYPREFLFRKDRDGFTAVASMLLLRERKGWTPVDDIFNLWRMAAGGIRPLARLMRMTPPERQQHVLDHYARPPSDARDRIKDVLNPVLPTEALPVAVLPLWASAE
ncbi:hypothetical protein CSHISOI_08324 [Colletotrichum shisoi]|uniref:Uncharacterized protein n=1 Tax=Colletotrichum shisoi TaxID=2078593 RepID=A0A5Q4BKK7_9PEZI|nr:hypothetical protein CSHISOI_08324 [Colletotrichum shisoi]